MRSQPPKVILRSCVRTPCRWISMGPGPVILHHHWLNHCPRANYSAAIHPAVFYEYVRTTTDDGPPPEQMFHDWSAKVWAYAVWAATEQMFHDWSVEVWACGVWATTTKARAVATTTTRM